MKKTFLFSALIALLFNLTQAQQLTKEETKRLKEEVKAYLKDLPGYQAKMQDIRATLDSNEAEIKRLKDELAAAYTKQAELENKTSDYETEVKRCHEENAALKQNGATWDTSTVTEETPSGGGSGGGKTNVTIKYADGSAPDAGATNTGTTNKGKKAPRNTAVNGTVYKVQFGLYQAYNINRYFDDPRYIGYENDKGRNRYVMGDFNDEETAINFVKDVRKMGIKDAFVAKYVNGVRVYEWSKNPKYKGKPVPSSVEDALEMEKRGKKGRKTE